MENKIIYVYPDYDTSRIDLKDFEKLSDSEKLSFAESSNDMVIYSLSEFEHDYNSGYLNNSSYIYIVKLCN